MKKCKICKIKIGGHKLLKYCSRCARIKARKNKRGYRAKRKQ